MSGGSLRERSPRKMRSVSAQANVTITKAYYRMAIISQYAVALRWPLAGRKRAGLLWFHPSAGARILQVNPLPQAYAFALRWLVAHRKLKGRWKASRQISAPCRLQLSRSPPTSRWMNAKPSLSATPRERQHLGYLEEFWTWDASGALQYAGHRRVASSAQAIGSEHRQQFRLASAITINRSFSKVKTLKAGTLVLRMVSPLQGREI